MEFDESKFGCAVDGDEEVKFSLCRLHFCDVDVEKADRIGLELFLRRLVTVGVRQSTDAVTLQTTMQG